MRRALWKRETNGVWCSWASRNKQRWIQYQTMWNDRRSFLKLAATALPALSQTNTRRTKPNVLVILTDDQGYGDMSCHGNPVLKTPNIDRLHAESVRFTDFHVAPMCTPTRGQLMSGVDALRNKATSVTAGRAFLRRDLPTMADVFRAGGYRTGIFGKWHLGDHYPYRPMDRGFEMAKYLPQLRSVLGARVRQRLLQWPVSRQRSRKAVSGILHRLLVLRSNEVDGRTQDRE